MINSEFYFKYIVLVSIFIIVFLSIYKKILMYLLFNDFFYKTGHFEFINNTYRINKFYNNKYKPFFNKYNDCNKNNFSEIPYLTKEELIEFNDDIISPPYKKCNLKCIPSCINDPVWYDKKCSIGQSTGGTSGKSTFIWMSKYNAYKYIYIYIYNII